MSKVRIETGPSPIFTRLFIDDREVVGVVRLWFDTGEINAHDGPRRPWNEATRVHIDLIPDELIFDGPADVEQNEVRPRKGRLG